MPALVSSRRTSPDVLPVDMISRRCLGFVEFFSDVRIFVSNYKLTGRGIFLIISLQYRRAHGKLEPLQRGVSRRPQLTHLVL